MHSLLVIFYAKAAQLKGNLVTKQLKAWFYHLYQGTNPEYPKFMSSDASIIHQPLHCKISASKLRKHLMCFMKSNDDVLFTIEYATKTLLTMLAHRRSRVLIGWLKEREYVDSITSKYKNS